MDTRVEPAYDAEYVGKRERLARASVRKLDHGLAARNLLVVLIAHQHIDHDPARFFRGLLRLDDTDRLDGIAGLYRLEPAGFEAAMDRAGRIGPVGDHARDQPEIIH